MNEELFRGVAALRWRDAAEHLGEFGPKDPRGIALGGERQRALVSRLGGDSAYRPMPSRHPEAREPFLERLMRPDCGLALYLELPGLSPEFRAVPTGALQSVKQHDLMALRADGGTFRGIPFIGARVFDLRGLPPAEGAELYGRGPELTELERLSIQMRPVRPPGTPTPEAVERKIRNGKRESLLQFLRDGELLGTGVAEGEREPVPAAEWPQEIAAIAEAFAAARLGRWRDLLVQAPLLPPATPPAVEAPPEVPVHEPEWVKLEGEIGRYLKLLVDKGSPTATRDWYRQQIGKQFPGTSVATFDTVWSDLTKDPDYTWLTKPGAKVKRRSNSSDKSAPE